MNTDKIKKDNKKALPKFLIILVVSMLVGAVCGFVAASVGFSNFGENFSAALDSVIVKIIPWAIPVISLMLLLPASIILHCAKKNYSGWDGENEQLSDKIENQLNLIMLLISIMTPLSFMVIGALIVYLPSQLSTTLLIIAVYFAAMAWATILQQKIVDLARKMNPEKQGSLYDTKFPKKWLDSCDEAERKLIGEAAYKSFRATNTSCVILWLLLILSEMIFNTGLMPLFIVMVIFAISQISYILSCMTHSKH